MYIRLTSPGTRDTVTNMAATRYPYILVQPQHRIASRLALRLTRQDLRACALLTKGQSQSQIAVRLGVSLSAVKKRFTKIYVRAGITWGIRHIRLAVLLYDCGLCACGACKKRFEPRDGAVA